MGEGVVKTLAGVVASLVAIATVARTLADVRPLVTKDAYHNVVLHPVTIFTLCFGTAYAASSSLQSSLLGCIVFMYLMHMTKDNKNILDMETIKRELHLDEDDDDAE